MTRMLRWVTSTWLLCAALIMPGCGGGDAPSDTTVQGRVLDAATGQPIAGATVQVAGQATQSDAQGRFTLVLPGGAPSLMQARQTGYAPALVTATPAPGGSSPMSLWLFPVGREQALASDAGGDVAPSGTAALLRVPVSALVDAATGQAFTGQARAHFTAIDLRAQPTAMPGGYIARTASGTQAIESSGAVHIELADAAAGRALELAPGRTATLRIPALTRAIDDPPTLRLYRLDTASGQWIEHGPATRAVGSAGAYYEGTVDRAGYWAVARPLDSVNLYGCVTDANGQLAANVPVYATGVDYSGVSIGVTNAAGVFRTQVLRGGVFSLVAASGNLVSLPTQLGAREEAAEYSECLVLKAMSAPELVTDPLSDGENGVTAAAGTRAKFEVKVGGANLRYQWRRNGVALPGANGPLLYYPVTEADNGARFSAIVSNTEGSVTSPDITLTIGDAPPPDEHGYVFDLVWAGFTALDMATAPFWLTNESSDALVSPEGFCSEGTVVQMLFDGAPATAGQAITPNATHTLDVTFDQCTVGSDMLRGQAVARFTAVRDAAGNTTFAGTTSLTQFFMLSSLASGRGDFAFTEAYLANGGLRSTLTPQPGSTLMSAYGTVAYFSSGSSAIENSDSGWVLQADDLAFTVGITPYVVKGRLVFDADANPQSGELRLTAEGLLVGRLYVESGELLVESHGRVRPFAGERGLRVKARPR